MALYFRCFLFVASVFILLPAAWPQAAQKGIDPTRTGKNALRFDHVGYRPARWNTEQITETETQHPNRGGFVRVYMTNVSDEPVRTAFYRLNGHDESYWRLGYLVAWDRMSDRTIEPGKTAVLEINGVSPDFAEGQPFDFGYIDRETWRSRGSVSTDLQVDPVGISFIHILPGLAEIEVHLRNEGDKAIEHESIEILGHEIENVEWRGAKANPNAIARVRLKSPLHPSDLVIAKVGVREGETVRSIYNHRRAFVDFFPIGTWGIEEGKEEIYRRNHVDTCVRGGSPEDAFFTETVPKYGFRAMTHTGIDHLVDTVRRLGETDAVTCWMLQDEPDWSILASNILVWDNLVRVHNRSKPTFLTLCRNTKFFDYAQIADIPCHDHYCVAAPSSSKWPERFGTYVEETAYYTEDLKYASEPKPIWVWSQGIHDGWGGRPKRNVPTPEEIESQLWLNVGRGAKGILWFTFKPDVGERYPDSLEMTRNLGRILRLMRADLLGSEPYEAHAKSSHPKVDVAMLVTWDKVFAIATNLDYEIDDEAYRWTTAEEARLEFDLPEWIAGTHAIELTAEGPKAIPLQVDTGHAEIEIGDLKTCRIFVVSDAPGLEGDYEKLFSDIVNDEVKEY